MWVLKKDEEHGDDDALIPRNRRSRRCQEELRQGINADGCSTSMADLHCQGVQYILGKTCC